MNHSYFPTLRDIRDGIIRAQINVLNINSRAWNSETLFKQIKSSYESNWETLFDIQLLGIGLDTPLTPKILSDPTHKITQKILYLYSMESFIYNDLNAAIREKDKSKIDNYGPFAAALGFIIHFANSNRGNKKLEGITKLFRGVRLRKSEIDEFRPGKK